MRKAVPAEERFAVTLSLKKKKLVLFLLHFLFITALPIIDPRIEKIFYTAHLTYMKNLMFCYLEFVTL